jgi:hypothetical protein
MLNAVTRDYIRIIRQISGDALIGSKHSAIL